jgi:hypothetical protein
MVVNVTMFVYAVPVIALAIACLRFAVGRRGNAPAFQARPAWRRDPRKSFLAVGAGGLIAGSVMFALASRDLKVYDAAPSCRDGFAPTEPLDRTCRIVTTRIRDAYTTSGRGASTHVVLALPDGSNANVVAGAERRGSVVRGFLRDGDGVASVQFFGNDIVAIETRSGLLDTNAMPAGRVQTWGLAGIALGVLGTLAALALAFRT